MDGGKADKMKKKGVGDGKDGGKVTRADGQGEKSGEREAKKAEKLMNEFVKKARSTLEAARKLHRKAREIFPAEAAGRDCAPLGSTSSKTPAKSSTSKAGAPSSKVRAQRLAGNAAKMAALASEARLGAAGAAQRAEEGGGPWEGQGRIVAKEAEDAAAEAAVLAADVAVHAIDAHTGLVEEKLCVLRQTCFLLRTGESRGCAIEGGASQEEGDAEQGGGGGVAAVFLTNVQWRKKAAKHASALKQISAEVRADRHALSACGDWAPSDGLAGGASVTNAFQAFHAACAKVEGTVAEAMALAEEVDDLAGAPPGGDARPPAKRKGGAAAGKEMQAPQLRSSEEEEEEEVEVRVKGRGQTAKAGRRRQLIESSEEEDI